MKTQNNICDKSRYVTKVQLFNCYKTQKLKMWQNSTNKVMTILKNLIYDQLQVKKKKKKIFK